MHPLEKARLQKAVNGSATTRKRLVVNEGKISVVYEDGRISDEEKVYGIRKSIFRPYKSEHEKDHRHWLIHQSFKKRLFVPLCFLMDRWLGKYMVRKREDIPDEPYNRNILILWDAFEDGIKDWNYNFYRLRDKNTQVIKNQEIMDDNWKRKEEMHWYKIPKFFIKLLMTIVLEDTVYREQINALMFQIQGKMNQQWNPEVQHKFPMYTNQCDMDVAYLIEWMKQQGKTGELRVVVKPKEEVEKDRVDFEKAMKEGVPAPTG